MKAAIPYLGKGVAAASDYLQNLAVHNERNVFFSIRLNSHAFLILKKGLSLAQSINDTMGSVRTGL
jgi:hypothetical protein